MNNTDDVFLLECDSYEDYLDKFITHNDLKYLRNIRFSRMLVELGYRSTQEIYNADQFKIRKEAANLAMYPIKKSLILFHDGIKITDPVLHELAEREKYNYQKILSTIIFLRYRLKSGFEISGYIDYENSLRKSNQKTEDSTDWKAVFMMRSFLRPKPTDLSFYNSRTSTLFHNDSDNYAVINDNDKGLIFMHKGDRKKIIMNQKKGEGNGDATRKIVFSNKYGHVILYDHLIRKKA